MHQMTDRGPSGWELQEMAKATGCTVVREHAMDTPHGPHRAYSIECHSHENKVALLDKLADFDSRSPEVRSLAEQIAQRCGGDTIQTMRGLHHMVKAQVRHIIEPGEIFTHTMRTLEVGRGDCDDTARALVALLRSIGIPARLKTIGWPPRHVYAEGQDDAGAWWPLEATIDAATGEDPLAAAKRLGILRDDIR